jgi:hypothetical protein
MLNHGILVQHLGQVVTCGEIGHQGPGSNEWMKKCELDDYGKLCGFFM